MKKLMMVLAFAGVSMAGMAQSETPELKYSVATNSFWSNWFVSADVAYEAFYSNQEKGMGFAKSPLKDFRSNVGASVAIGKWFTPGLGLRTKINGIWGRTVSSEDAKANAIKFFNIQEQAMFNLSNMLCGYSETRVWNFIPYAGFGMFRNFTANENCHGISLGLLNTWKVSNRVLVNFDLGFNVSDDDIDGATQGHDVYATTLAKSDRYFTAELGLTFNLGKTGWNKTPDVDAIKALSDAQIAALNAQLADANAENARLNNLIKNHKCPEGKEVIIKEFAAAPVSVFFNLGKSKIACKKDLQNVKALVDLAGDKKFVVTGYADSQTGSADLNQSLSEKRANAVVDELVNMGVNRDKIEVVAAGGVDTLTPVSYNRRATVEIK